MSVFKTLPKNPDMLQMLRLFMLPAEKRERFTMLRSDLRLV